jgi:hypothetical protein
VSVTKIADIVVGIPYGNEGKRRWQRVGALLQHDQNDPSKGPGFTVSLDATFNPAGAPQRDGQVLLSCFHPDTERSARRPTPPDTYRRPPLGPAADLSDMDDDIPF